MTAELPEIQTILEDYLPAIDPSQDLAMTSPNERAFCRWTAEQYFTGRGRMIELGCWLGSFTRELARGLLANQRLEESSRRIHVFDQFVWLERWQDQVQGTGLEGRLAPGEDYKALYLERIAEFSGLVDATAADLSNYRYSGEAIEILVLDVMKSPILTKNIAEQFFPALIPGRALVLNQDYFHFGHPWIHIAAYHLRDSLQLTHVIPYGCMAVFETVAEPRVGGLAAEPIDFTPAEISAAYEWNRSVAPQNVHDTLAAAEVQLLLHRGDTALAEEQFRTYTAGEFRESPSFRQLYEYNKRWGLLEFEDPYYA